MQHQSVKQSYVLPQWAPRLEPQLIRRLYLSDANGMLDEELLEEVSFGLYCRCLSIRDVTAAYMAMWHVPFVAR